MISLLSSDLCKGTTRVTYQAPGNVLDFRGQLKVPVRTGISTLPYILIKQYKRDTISATTKARFELLHTLDDNVSVYIV